MEHFSYKQQAAVSSPATGENNAKCVSDFSLKKKNDTKPQHELTRNPCLAHKAMKAFKYYRACLRSCSQSTAGLHSGTGFNYVQVQGLLGRR